MVQFCLSRSRSQRSTQSPQTTLPSRRMNKSSFNRSQLPQRKPFSRLGSTSDRFILQTPDLPHPPARRSTVAHCARLAKPEHVGRALDACLYGTEESASSSSSAACWVWCSLESTGPDRKSV